MMKMRLKMKNRLPRPEIDKLRPRHGHKYTKYKICHSIMMAICYVSNNSATFKAQFIKKLSNTERVEEKSIKKRVIFA